MVALEKLLGSGGEVVIGPDALDLDSEGVDDQRIETGLTNLRNSLGLLGEIFRESDGRLLRTHDIMMSRVDGRGLAQSARSRPMSCPVSTLASAMFVIAVRRAAWNGRFSSSTALSRPYHQRRQLRSWIGEPVSVVNTHSCSVCVFPRNDASRC